MQRQGGRKALSPTAQLLRSSRLFSIPEPLPRPHVGLPHKGSANATLPYPIRQAITTPPSSLARGDYGLKRNLPLRRLARTQNPVVRVVELDTIEQVTDYEFAADHTQTLKKIQEIGLAPSYASGSRYATDYKGDPRDAFDETVDNTHLTSGEDPLKISRWRQSPGSLVNRTETQFEMLLKEPMKALNTQERAQVSNSGSVAINKGFMATLRQNLLKEHQDSSRQRAMDEGRDVEPNDLELDEAGYENRLLKLYEEFRASKAFDSKLHVWIARYLDLPEPILEADKTAASGRISDVFASPRSTHPSAGVSYLRTNAIIENHPTLGPLTVRSPVQGRVLQHSTKEGRINHYATYGIGGIVMRVDQHTTTQKKGRVPHGTFDFEESGGSKVWVNPTRMNIDRDGKIRLQADHANSEIEVAIKKNKLPWQAMTRSTIRSISQRRSFSGKSLDRRIDRTKYSQTMYGDWQNIVQKAAAKPKSNDTGY